MTLARALLVRLVRTLDAQRTAAEVQGTRVPPGRQPTLGPMSLQLEAAVPGVACRRVALLRVVLQMQAALRRGTRLAALDTRALG
jgi:hypothetical protein